MLFVRIYICAGVAVPSLTSFIYYIVFLIVLAIWSCHLSVQLRGVVRVLRCGLTFYSMLHLVVLYLYQFQTAQQNIPLQPYDTTKSLLARFACIYCCFVHNNVHTSI